MNLKFHLTTRFLTILCAFSVLPSCLTTFLDKKENPINSPKVRKAALAEIPDEHFEYHKSLFIADQHTDSLLWARDLMVRNDYGHLDIPRMVEGNIHLQVFAMPTERHFHIGKASFGNSIGLLTWFQSGKKMSDFERALRAADEMDDIIARSANTKNAVRYIKTKGDLRKFRRDYDTAPAHARPIGVLLGLEGLNGLRDNTARPGHYTIKHRRRELEILAERGYRTISPAHFEGNAGFGSAQSPTDSSEGMSPFGEQELIMMEELGYFTDLTHTSRPAIDDILEAWRAGELRKPIVSSHTGVLPYMHPIRAFPERDLKDVAETGGVIGMAYFRDHKTALTVEEIAKSIRYVVDVLDNAGYKGIDHVSLGSDFDGTVKAPFDASELMLLTYELRKPQYRFSDTDIRKIAGENLYGFLLKVLPD